MFCLVSVRIKAKRTGQNHWKICFSQRYSLAILIPFYVFARVEQICKYIIDDKNQVPVSLLIDKKSNKYRGWGGR